MARHETRSVTPMHRGHEPPSPSSLDAFAAEPDGGGQDGSVASQSVFADGAADEVIQPHDFLAQSAEGRSTGSGHPSSKQLLLPTTERSGPFLPPLLAAALVLLLVAASGWLGWRVALRRTAGIAHSDPQLSGGNKSDDNASRADDRSHEPSTSKPTPDQHTKARPTAPGNAEALAGARLPLALTGAHVVKAPAAGVVTYSPAFGPRGNTMFFHMAAASGTTLVSAEIAPSGNLGRITPLVDDGAHNYHVRPSPDGTRIAFDSDRDGERAVYVARIDGAEAQKVSGNGYAANPNWSPDGNALLLIKAERLQRRVWNLWHLTLDTGELRRVSLYAYGQTWGGWFPDGQRIAFSHEDQLVILDLQKKTRRVYPSPKRGRLVRTPAVSPDGGAIIFQLYRDGVWVLDAATGTMRRVLADPSAEEFAWSADGHRVAYHSRQSGTWRVWIASVR